MTALRDLESDLAWRDAELATIKLLIVSRTIGAREKTVLLRAGWALLYAHYEGFCKFALTLYYDCLSQKRKCGADLALTTKAFALDADLKKLRSMPKYELVDHIMNFEDLYLKHAVKFPEIETESNLWPNTLEDLLKDADLIIESVDRHRNSLKTLVGRRNKIAHGERDMILEYDYFEKFEAAVKDVLIELAISIDEKLAKC